MKFFVDECVPPSLAAHLNAFGHDAVHPRDRGRLGETDHAVFARAVADDRIVVIERASDFRALAAGADLHPGLVILPSAAKDHAQRPMDLVRAEVPARGSPRPGDLFVNAVFTIDAAGRIDVEPLP